MHGVMGKTKRRACVTVPSLERPLPLKAAEKHTRIYRGKGRERSIGKDKAAGML